MNQPATAISIATLGVALLFSGSTAAQTAADSQPQPDRAAAYYHYAMGHIYAELAGGYGNKGDYLTKAIEHYKAALKADPGARVVAEELTDLYIQAGRLSEAVSEAEELLKQNPDHLDARRILGRIYMRMIGDPQENRVRENMLRKAIEQYEQITQKDAQDVESWVTLGRLHNVAHDSVAAEKAYKKALGLEPNNEYALSGLAMVYNGVGDTKSALDLWKRLAETNPTPRTLRALASAHEQMRDYAAAAETLQRAAEMAPDDREIRRDLAQAWLLADQHERALELYRQLAEADPKDPLPHLRLSQIYRQKRDFAKAWEAHQKAAQLDPPNVEIRYNEVNLLDAEGKENEAIARLRDLLSSTAKKSYSASERSNRAILMERLGSMYRSIEQYKPAVETFQQIIELDPDSAPRATAQTIDTWRQAKDFTRAEQEAEAAARKYPNDRMIAGLRASVLADQGKFDQAIAEAKRLAGKNERETHLALAQIYEKAKRFDDMAKALDQAEQLSDTKEEKQSIAFMRGAMYEKMKQLEEAEAEFQKVLEADPDNASALNYLGYMLADRNVRLEEAHRLISKALELDPNNGAYLDSLGWVNYRMNKLEEAERDLLRALDRVSRDPVVHEHLGDVYFSQGKLKEAIAQWQISLKEWEASSRAEFDSAEVAKIQKKLEGARVRLAKESSGVKQ